MDINSVGKIKNLRLVKALRGQSLAIDLGRTYTGTLTAWLKRSPTDTTYRSFTIVDGRYLFLPKEKAQDYYTNGIVTEAVLGRWFFDLRHLPIGSTDPNDEKILVTGLIEFFNQVTDSVGDEISATPELESGMINLSNTSTTYGTVGQMLRADELIKDISEIKVEKAMRGQALTIDLGRDFIGYKLEAWMKKSANADTYRSFTIVDDRFLFLPEEKTADYYTVDGNTLIEEVKGKWFYDVRALPDGSTHPDDETIVAQGEIYFKNNITGSGGQEITYTDPIKLHEFINLNDTPSSYVGQAGKFLKVNSTEDGVEFGDVIEDKHFVFNQGVPNTVWNINHNLNKRPSISTADIAGALVLGKVDYIDLNNVKITFNASFAGKAFLN
tara:strand:+ start:177 stop:1328 length:1152 start_codon:yes stop_codon:yes gene_type:complete